MFHSSVLPVGLPSGLILGAFTLFLMSALGIPPAEMLAAAKLVGGGANLLAGGAKNLAMLDLPSLLMVRPLSFVVTLLLIAAMAAERGA